MSSSCWRLLKRFINLILSMKSRFLVRIIIDFTNSHNCFEGLSSLKSESYVNLICVDIWLTLLLYTARRCHCSNTDQCADCIPYSSVSDSSIHIGTSTRRPGPHSSSTAGSVHAGCISSSRWRTTAHVCCDSPHV